MMSVIVDSCVFLDIFTQDARWFDWSSHALVEAANKGTIVTNSVIYAEISIRFERIEDLETRKKTLENVEQKRIEYEQKSVSK